MDAAAEGGRGRGRKGKVCASVCREGDAARRGRAGCGAPVASGRGNDWAGGKLSCVQASAEDANLCLFDNYTSDACMHACICRRMNAHMRKIACTAPGGLRSGMRGAGA